MDYQISLIAIAAAAAAEISQVLYSSLHSLHYFKSFQVILAHLQVDFQAFFQNSYWALYVFACILQVKAIDDLSRTNPVSG